MCLFGILSLSVEVACLRTTELVSVAKRIDDYQHSTTIFSILIFIQRTFG